MKKILILVLSTVIYLQSINVFATPSTQIWNPSTDVQGYQSCHLGIDDYFTISKNGASAEDKQIQYPTDVGITCGPVKNLEVGIDFFEPTTSPAMFNLKYGLAEKNSLPAIAVGIMNVGTKKDVTNYNIAYIVLAKNFDFGRLSIGGYSGNKKLLVDENGSKANTGLIATFDKVINSKVWVAADYASGKSWYGNLSLGFSYTFAPNTSVIFAYDIYNNDKVVANDTFTTQLDINF